ncbi:MAG: YifB family Mg chelatase-like AAA ATPase [Pseudomonadales bacterium]|nr:YifB family Mg chelatase-like AAA ATPase [Pseudomonadales bacterium]
MSFATLYSRALIGVEAVQVTVETHLSNGLPGFAIVGLPETAVKESKERVRSAIINSGLDFPTRRITVNLAPADIPKAGGRYDLAIALSILAASGQLDINKLDSMEILGELALDGSVRAVQGVIPAILAARSAQRALILPQANQREIELAHYGSVLAVEHLIGLCESLQSESGFSLQQSPRKPPACPEPPSFKEFTVQGQLLAKRAIQIAAAGGHNLLMVGPPGCGKSLLAQVMVRLLPALNEEQALEVAAIRSISEQKLNSGDFWQRPIRSPHHSATAVALVGGGNRASPGEISLAHHGILFLDELAEFKPSVLDSLREPMETGQITISRANYQVVFPARFQLLAAMNPCPCGHATDSRVECRCSPDRVSRYLGKLSGPLLDRIDLIVEMASLSRQELLSRSEASEDWEGIRQRVAQCQAAQTARQGKLNTQLLQLELDEYCQLNSKLENLLANAMDSLGLSARTVHRILRVARTLADLDEQSEIAEGHLLQAIGFRKSVLNPSLAA